MQKVNIQEVKNALVQKTANSKLDNEKELSDFVNEIVVLPFEKEAAEKNGSSWAHDARCDYIENLDEFNDCVNDFIREYEFN